MKSSDEPAVLGVKEPYVYKLYDSFGGIGKAITAENLTEACKKWWSLEHRDMRVLHSFCGFGVVAEYENGRVCKHIYGVKWEECDCSRWTLNSNNCCVNCGRKRE